MEKEKKILHQKIEDYLKQKISCKNLYNFAWEKIDYFEKHKNQLPAYNPDKEGVYWYAIWQLQHLADKDHEEDGSLQKELMNILSYLNMTQELPVVHYGKRP